jgi:nitrogen fixation NifU-like protein
LIRKWRSLLVPGKSGHVAKNLQQQVFGEIKESYGEKAYLRSLEPLYMGPMKDPDGHARVTGGCGETIQMFLKFDDDRVTDASFQTDGCGSSKATGSFAAEMSLGKTPDELLEIRGEDILKRMGRIPEADQHCAFLAAASLYEALNDYMIKMTRRRKIQHA